MTKLLDSAVAKLAALPPQQQDRFACWLLEELPDEEWWDSQFSTTQEVLGKLAEEVRGESAAGRTTQLAPDKF